MDRKYDQPETSCCCCFFMYIDQLKISHDIRRNICGRIFLLYVYNYTYILYRVCMYVHENRNQFLFIFFMVP